MSHFRPNIESLAAYVPGEQPQEGGWTKLNTNENPYPPSPKVLEAIKAAATNDLRLYPDPLASEARRKVAYAHRLDPENVLLGHGADELLSMAFRAFAGPGAKAAFLYPSYTLYETQALIADAPFEWVDFPEDFSIPASFPPADARLVIVPNPNSPSGTFQDPEAFDALAERTNGVLVIDEAYADFSRDTCREVLTRHTNVLLFRTLSKSFSLAGLRNGIALGPVDLIDGLLKVKDSYNVDRLAIAGVIAAFSDQEHMRRNVQRVRKTRARLSIALEKLGFKVPPSEANFVLARWKEPAKSLYEALKEKKILVRYFEARGLENCLRISIGTDPEIDALLATLRTILAG